MATLFLGMVLDTGSETSDDAEEEGQDVPDQEPSQTNDEIDDAASEEENTSIEDSLRAFGVTSDEEVTGTDDADVFFLEPDPEEVESSYGRIVVSNATVEGGAGDDIMFLHKTGAVFSYGGGSISGGDGDDSILVSGVDVLIDGGAGNDVIETPADGRIWSSTILGGEGDDQIDVSFQDGDGFGLIDGGAGNDYIDVRDSSNGNVIPLGGEGNDTIHVGDDLHWGGTGYTTGGNGGAGDDVLIQDLNIRELLEPLSSWTNPMVMTGGEGADTFQLTTVTSSGAYESDSEVRSTEAMRVTDFEVGIDMIVFDLSSATSGVYSVNEAEMSEDATTGQTTISVLLESDNATDQELIITVNATGLTWDDVSFVGATPTLDPVPV
ncbi:hypothetical protein [Planktotalea sp.]|uniref:hypothetical protein n=1 Tax=Planktotalea sp. TaxID=2029877 RepID=UPI00329A25D0